MSIATHGATRGSGSAAPVRDGTLPGTWRVAPVGDPSVVELLEDLVREYTARYGNSFDGQPHSARVEINRYPPERFAAPLGAFVVYEEDGVPLTGGAIMPGPAGYQAAATPTQPPRRTAEVKRVWTRSDQRGRGLAAATMAQLEARAVELGYTHLYLTTGPAQPEAVALYLRTGYTPDFDPTHYPATNGAHPFTKELS